MSVLASVPDARVGDVWAVRYPKGTNRRVRVLLVSPGIGMWVKVAAINDDGSLGRCSYVTLGVWRKRYALVSRAEGDQ